MRARLEEKTNQANLYVINPLFLCMVSGMIKYFLVIF